MSAPAVPVERRWALGAFRRHDLGIVAFVAFVVLIALAVVAVFAPLLVPVDPNAIHLSDTLLYPGPGHPLGTDGNGRDILSRLIGGTRTSLAGPALVVLISTLIGLPLGLLGGLHGGLLDAVLGRIWDVLLAFPPLLLAILIVATFGRGFWGATLAVAVTYVPLMARVARGHALAERERPYIAALRLQGFGSARILGRHILPNVAPGILSQSTLNFGYALLDLAALAFIGLGVQPPTPDWGSMLTDAKSTMLQSINPVTWPSVAIIVTVLAVNVVGEHLAERSMGAQQ
jgi:peptide/nickel transport system permease protein